MSQPPLNDLNQDTREAVVSSCLATATAATSSSTCCSSGSNTAAVPLDGVSTSAELTRFTSGSECLVSTTSSTLAIQDGNGKRKERVHPAAMVLRLRVTQVVCGIMTCVLGAVAVIEEQGEFRVSTGIVAGVTTVLASIASIRATFDGPFDRSRWIYYAQTVKSSGRSCVLSSLWAIAIVSNMVMLAFVVMAFFTSSKNLIIIGSLELTFGILVLVILVVIMCMAVHCKELQRK